ncbi:hypothetical protein B0H11DRAFT_2082530 [Mycena galericulata]|nr:hypothetical protein B0H11DRAFT_2082530 [Mycena galericulata]
MELTLASSLLMDWVVDSHIDIDILPDDVLALILKLVADSPMASFQKLPPPVAASRVSHRWRTIALACPELWTKIRLSHRSQSWGWAPVFLRRSGTRLLDVSINLESYSYRNGKPHHASPIYMDWALEILGHHVGRWQRLALRAWHSQLHEMWDFLASAPSIARLESVEFSSVDGPHWVDPFTSVWDSTAPSLSRLFHSQSFRSLRINTWLDVPQFRAVHTLDIDFEAIVTFGIHDGLRRIFGPTSTLETMAVRNFYPRAAAMAGDPIDACTIRSFAISFAVPFYYPKSYDPYDLYGGGYGGFESLTNIFSLPNIEYLEILGGFTGSAATDRNIVVPEDWEAPLFPHLLTLRLEDVDFSRRGLAFIQSLSQNITALHLIHTTGNNHLLVRNATWPDLRTLVVETQDDNRDTAWLVSFISMRAAMGASMCITELTIPLGCWSEGEDAAYPAPHIRRQRDGPSPALMDAFPGHAFYIDEFDMRGAAFEHVEAPYLCDYCFENWSAAFDVLDDAERLDAEIAEDFKAARARVRAMGTWRELKKQKRGLRGPNLKRKARAGRASTSRRDDLREDFCLV